MRSDYPRLNISISRELKQRLNGNRDKINISRICQQAIHKELDKIDAEKPFRAWLDSICEVTA